MHILQILVQCCVLQILGLLELLVNYGYYCNPNSVKSVVHPLIAMLDGRIDVPHASKYMQLGQVMLLMRVGFS